MAKTHRPEDVNLGTGMASQAASTIERNKARNCEEGLGGMYDFASHRCITSEEEIAKRKKGNGT